MKKVKCIFIAIIATMALLVPSFAMAEEGDARSKARMETVIGYVEDALRYARFNVPGAKYPHILVNGYNVDTKKPAEWKYKGNTYYPANITSQQNFLRVLVGLTNLTGDQKYKDIGAEQVRFWFDNYAEEGTGLLYAGEHTLVDVKTGEILSYNEHELKQVFPYYEFMYEVHPEGVKRYLEGCWNSHIIDWSNLSMNRHGYYNKPMSALWDSEYTDTSIDFDNGHNLAFQNAGDDFINFAFFIAEKTGDKGPEIWGRRMLQKFIDTVNPTTGLSGAQYGEMTGGDRLFLQYGPELGDIAKEYNYINKYKIKTIAGFAPQYLLPYVERTGDQEVLDYIVNSVEGTAKYVYDAETNTLKTPMWSDGTNHQGYVVQRAGYQGVPGKKTRETNETTHTQVLHGAVQTYFAHESETIWQFARDLAKGFGVGEIGTKPGENVSLNMEITTTDPEIVFTLLYLYNKTGFNDYLTLAEKIGENMIVAYNNLIEGKTNLSYTNINREDMVALLRIEATVRNMPDAVDNGIISNASVEFDYDGAARTTDHAMLWSKTRVKASNVTIDDGEIVLPIETPRVPAFNDISGNSAEGDIRALYSMGAINGVSADAFAPDKPITRAEFISIVVKLCNFPPREKKFGIYADVADDAWYRNAVEIARNNGLIDDPFLKDGLFAPNDYITMEEMVAVVVKTLISLNKDVEYKDYGAINKLSDAHLVSDWAKTYIGIACNYQLINDTQLSPSKVVSRAEAASMLVLLNDMIGKDFKDVTAIVFPETATKQTANWTSGDRNIFDVDKNGRLYPMAEGTTTLTAEVDGVTDTRNVHVIFKKDWMLKNVKIDGVLMKEFVPTTMEYEVNLLLGTKDYPKIEAESYSGEQVNIEIPETFPGTVTITVGDSEEKYLLNVIAERIDYKMNDDFDGYLLDLGLHNRNVGDAIWAFNSKAWNGHATSVLVKNIPSPTDAEDKDNQGLILPYYKGVQIQLRGRFPDKPYMVGKDADDTLIVLDFDLMTSAPISGVDVRLGHGSIWPVRMRYTETTINAYTGSGIVPMVNYTPGVYNNIKIVLDPKNLNVDWYVDNKKVLEEQSTLSVADYDRISQFLIALDSAQSEPGTLVYLDNVKVYQIPTEYEELIAK